MFNSKNYLVLGVLLTICCVCSLATADFGDWSSFQNHGNLVSSETKLPVTWSPNEGIAWKSQIEGYGQSTPLVHNDLIVLTSTSGANKEKCHITAFSLNDGSQVWQVDFDNPSPVANNNYVSRAAPTPAIDDNGVVAMFEGGLLVAVDYQGKIRWQRDLTKEFGAIESRHGLGGSVEQNANNAFVWVERDASPYLLAIDKNSGETVWKADGLGATSWSTPRLVSVKDKSHLVCSASGLVAGFDPENGNRLWELKDVAGNTTATPIPYGESQFILAASEGRGEESSGNAAASNGLVRISLEGDQFRADFVWRAKKATSSFGSPIVVDDRVYFVNRTGVIYCLDGKTGEELYTLRGSAGSIWATPLAAGNHLYLFGKNGTTAVYKIGDKLEEVSVNPLWESTSPASATGDFGSGHVLYACAVASQSLLLRRGDILYSIKN